MTTWSAVRMRASFPPTTVLPRSWEESADQLQWTFTLRPNIQFHDGTALTADDVKFSLDSVLIRRPSAFSAPRAQLSRRWKSKIP